jgi:hypothetical protein
MTTKQELFQANVELERKNKDLGESLADWIDTNAKTLRKVVELESKLKEMECNQRDDQSIIKQVRFACSHRIRVTHDCDVSEQWVVKDDGKSERVPVCEEVRFLREIVRLCQSNELPF